jgi:DNA-binding SARP family transcriptional activator
MKDFLEAKLLGTPELRWQNQMLDSIPPKLCAVLYYLCVQGKSVPRKELEELFWGSGSSENLRQALHHLRALPGAQYWLRTSPEVRVNIRSNLGFFEVATSGGHHRQALEIWRSGQPAALGSTVLLHGFSLENVPAFDDWLEVERARIGMLYLESLESRAFELEQAGAINEALTVVQTLLHEDPLNESAYRAAMRLSYRKAQPEMARYYFERCRRVLRQELGTQPLEETMSLARNSEVAGVYTAPETPTLRQAFERLLDPRARHGQRYPLAPLLGLILIALLCGSKSLRKISLFAQEHPVLLHGLGFRNRTAPGRSSISELLDQLDPLRLQAALDSVARLPDGLRIQPLTALELLNLWTLEVHHGLASKSSTVRLRDLIEHLGWPGLHDWLTMADTGDGSISVR